MLVHPLVHAGELAGLAAGAGGCPMVEAHVRPRPHVARTLELDKQWFVGSEDPAAPHPP